MLLRTLNPTPKPKPSGVFSAQFQLHYHLCSFGQHCLRTKAAAVILATFSDLVRTPLEDFDAQVACHALDFIHNREHALDFAKRFFKQDLGILAIPVWPNIIWVWVTSWVPTVPQQWSYAILGHPKIGVDNFGASSFFILMELASRIGGKEAKLQPLARGESVARGGA